MAIAERGAAEAGQRIADALGGAGLPYALGGALALAIAGVPRGTADVDVNVFVTDDRVPEAIKVLAAIGIDIDEVSAMARSVEQGMFVGRWDGMRIDVFLPSIPFALEAERTRILVTREGEPLAALRETACPSGAPGILRRGFRGGGRPPRRSSSRRSRHR